MELKEKLRKVSFHCNCSLPTLFLLYTLIRLFCRAQQSRLSSPGAAEVLPCLLLAWHFSWPLSGQPPAGNSSCVHGFVLCWLSRGPGTGTAEEPGRVNLCVMLHGQSGQQGAWLSVPLLSFYGRIHFLKGASACCGKWGAGDRSGQRCVY